MTNKQLKAVRQSTPEVEQIDLPIAVSDAILRTVASQMTNWIGHVLDKDEKQYHSLAELQEVIGELQWLVGQAADTVDYLCMVTTEHSADCPNHHAM